MQNQESFLIANATFQQLRIIVQQWIKYQGWNPGVQDAKAVWAVDPQGFFVGKLQGKMIGSISGVKYTQTKTGFIGLYVVLPQYRGKGYGLKLFKKALQYLNGYNIGLSALISQQQNYKKSGFKHFYNIVRYEFLGQNKPQNYIKNQHIKYLNEGQVQFEKVFLYDQQMFYQKRVKFLQQFFSQKDGLVITYCNNNRDVEGYGVIRKSAQGYRIGPLFANSSQIAFELIKQFRYFVGQKQKIYIDVPDVNRDAIDLIKKIQSSNQTSLCGKMYTQFQPKVNMKKIFGQTTLTVG